MAWVCCTEDVTMRNNGDLNLEFYDTTLFYLSRYSSATLNYRHSGTSAYGHCLFSVSIQMFTIKPFLHVQNCICMLTGVIYFLRGLKEVFRYVSIRAQLHLSYGHYLVTAIIQMNIHNWINYKLMYIRAPIHLHIISSIWPLLLFFVSVQINIYNKIYTFIYIYRYIFICSLFVFCASVKTNIFILLSTRTQLYILIAACIHSVFFC